MYFIKLIKKSQNWTSTWNHIYYALIKLGLWEKKSYSYNLKQYNDIFQQHLVVQLEQYLDYWLGIQTNVYKVEAYLFIIFVALKPMILAHGEVEPSFI